MKPRQRLSLLARRLGLSPEPEPQPETPYAYRAPDPETDLDWRKRVRGDVSLAEHDRRFREARSGKPLQLEEHELSPLWRALPPARVAALEDADDRAAARLQVRFADQEQGAREVWTRAIAALPGALVHVLEDTLAALDEAERLLVEKRERLRTLPADGDELWLQRRALLITQAEGLEDLVQRRRDEYRQMCLRAAEQLDTVLTEQHEVAQQAADAAAQAYREVVERERAKVARLQMEQHMIAAARSALSDPREVERRLGGRVVTEPKPVFDLAAQRAAERAMLPYLLAGSDRK